MYRPGLYERSLVTELAAEVSTLRQVQHLHSRLHRFARKSILPQVTAFTYFPSYLGHYNFLEGLTSYLSSPSDLTLAGCDSSILSYAHLFQQFCHELVSVWPNHTPCYSLDLLYDDKVSSSNLA